MEQQNIAEKIEAAWMEWQRVYEDGGTSPCWTDGKELNFIRKKIQRLQGEVEQNNNTLERRLLELPPIMEEKYMKYREEICAEAKKMVQLYKKNEDYQYLKENIPFLGAVEVVSMRLPPEIILEYLKELETAVINNDFPMMRRKLNDKKILTRLHECRLELEEVIEDMVPF